MKAPKIKNWAEKVNFLHPLISQKTRTKREIRVTLTVRTGVKFYFHMANCSTGPLVPGQVFIFKEEVGQ